MENMESICLQILNDLSNFTNTDPETTNDGTSQVVHLSKEDQQKVLNYKEVECRCRMATEPPTLTGLYCNRTWDNLLCWDDTPVGTVAYQRCPSYINNFVTTYYASRTCLSDGTWASNPALSGSKVGWTNYTGCEYHGNTTVEDNDYTEHVSSIFKEHHHRLRMMYNVGYTLSLASLIVAFIIMIYFRKLHCSRNTIHLHLFAAFIFRAAISLIRDNFMVAWIGFPKDVVYNETSGIYLFTDGPHWECRLFFAIFQYTLAASYIWIFTEAVYLHMLIFVSVFTEKVKVRWFIAFGWLFPLTFVAPWCISRYTLDNTLCWNTHSNRSSLVWILQSPIMVTVVLNFIFFINIIRVLYTKLKSPQCPDTKKNRYRRLARSTLFLVPTFGVYYIIFTIPSTTKLDDTVEFVLLFVEMFFNSFQGFFIALVLCFINAEVRVQIRRSFEKTKWCPCYNPLGMNTRTDYLRGQSFTRADSKRDNKREQDGLEMGELPSNDRLDNNFNGNGIDKGSPTKNGQIDSYDHSLNTNGNGYNGHSPGECEPFLEKKTDKYAPNGFYVER